MIRSDGFRHVTSASRATTSIWHKEVRLWVRHVRHSGKERLRIQHKHSRQTAQSCVMCKRVLEYLHPPTGHRGTRISMCYRLVPTPESGAGAAHRRRVPVVSSESTPRTLERAPRVQHHPPAILKLYPWSNPPRPGPKVRPMIEGMKCLGEPEGRKEIPKNLRKEAEETPKEAEETPKVSRACKGKGSTFSR